MSLLARFHEPISIHDSHVVKLLLRLQIYAIIRLILVLDPLNVLQINRRTVIILKVDLVDKSVDCLYLARDIFFFGVDCTFIDNEWIEHKLIAIFNKFLDLVCVVFCMVVVIFTGICIATYLPTNFLGNVTLALGKEVWQERHRLV